MDNTLLILVVGGITATLQLVGAALNARYNRQQFEIYLKVFTRITALETQMALLLPQHFPHKKETPGD